MKRFILIAGFICLMLGGLMAQNEEDVLRYSNTPLMGTARYLGLGGAYGAIGADFSSLSSNPAGIGLYKKSEFTITPSLYFANSESNYLGQMTEDDRNNFAFGNAGIVLTMETVDRLDRNAVNNFQIGFGINRLKDFNNQIYIEGVNGDNSLLDTYLEYAGTKNPENLNGFDTRLAFDTYLIDTLPGEDPYTYVDAYSYIGGFSSALQRKSIETKGSINEWVLSGGMNVDDKFYFGLTFGFPYIRYIQNSTYNEQNLTEPDRDLDEFTYREELETRGGGFNIKVGTIARPVQWLRIGAAYHSPTWYNNLNDSWNTRMNAYYTNGDSFSAQSPIGDYSYDIQTPWKAMGSIAVLFGRYGLISADYEYVDYSKGKLKPAIEFSAPNNIIANSFNSASNFRLGTEWNVGLMQVRGGYAYYGSPFESGVNDGKLQAYSAGLGFRSNEYFFDAAFVYSVSDQDYYLYGTNDIRTDPAKLTYSAYNLLFTFGYRFQ
ncbi:MAG: OmpP1/FadL family transporter [Bacteroidales bacterium]